MAQQSPYFANSRRWWHSRATIGVLLIFVLPLLLMAIGWSLRGLPGLPKPQTRPGRLPVAHWEARATLGTPRDDFGIATVDGRIWVLGGTNGARASRLDTTEVYDPVANAWAYGPKLTTARSSFRAVALDKTIYLFGGASPQAAAVDTAEALDTVTGRWRTLPALPTPRSGHAVVALDGLIYALGGSGNGKELGAVDAFDPATNRWRAVAALPTPRSNLAAVALNGKLYAFGGLQGDAPSAVLEVFDLASGTWSAGPPLLTPMANFDATVLDGRIYALSRGNNQVLDPRVDRWIAATEMPTPRDGQGVATSGDAFYAIGGRSEVSQSALNVVESYVLGAEEEPDTFSATGYNPAGAAAVVLGLLFTVVSMTTMLAVSRRRPRHNRDDPEPEETVGGGQ